MALFTAGHGHSVIWNDSSGGTGTLFGWGNNAFGQTGIVTDGLAAAPDCDPMKEYRNDTTADYPDDRTDVDNLTLPVDPVKLEGGDGNTTALLTDGTLIAWGRNTADTGHQSDVPSGTFLDFSSTNFHGAAISTCYADCDGDGVVNAQHWGLDYICFLSLYQANDIAADCNGDNALTAADLSCFFNLYQGGCTPP